MAKTTLQAPPPPPRPTLPKSTLPTFIRPASLADVTQIGRLAARTYLHDPLDQFLAPSRFQHYRHYERGYIQRARKRFFSTRIIGVVACTTADLGTPIGHAIFERLGDDEAAKSMDRDVETWWRLCLWIMASVYPLWVSAWWFLVGGNKSDSPENIRAFNTIMGNAGDAQWEVQERKCRWHARSVVVSEEFQRQGIGKMLMREVLQRAERENVVVGLESSARGEGMYRSVGFGLLGRFQGTDFEKDQGGVMMWTPPAWKQEESVKI